jgi:hypothetical protein
MSVYCFQIAGILVVELVCFNQLNHLRTDAPSRAVVLFVFSDMLMDVVEYDADDVDQSGVFCLHFAFPGRPC